MDKNKKPATPSPIPGPSKYTRLTLIFVLAIAALMLSTATRNPFLPQPKEIGYSEFLSQVEKDRVREVDIYNHEAKIRGKFNDGKEFSVDMPEDPKLVDRLKQKDIRFRAKNPGMRENVTSFLTLMIVPALVIFGIWFLFLRQAQMGGGQALSFGRSRAKLVGDSLPRVTFDDVAGVDEAVEELEEIVEFLKDPKRFQNLGAKIPKGVLLVGQPGTGKTLLARAIAGEANVPFFHMSGSDFVEMFVGVGASRVRDLFETAKKSTPCLIFVDEIDAVGRQRGAGLGGGHDEREQTLNQLLVEMDGFDPNAGVILIAATNRPDILDPALLRPGRFDRRIVVDSPDVNGRKSILEVHARGKKISQSVDFDIIARRTPGFTGADLANVINEAALLAARKAEEAVEMKHIEEAIERNIAGPERKSKLISDKEKRNTAYHEAGHALAAKLIPASDPVHKISILPRGLALGYTLQLPIEDRLTVSRTELLNDMVVLLGGRVAEKLVFDEITTGAHNDIERATKIARRMVTEFGMSEKIGPITLGKKHEAVFLGRDFGEDRDYSEEVAAKIDSEVKSMVDECYQRAVALLSTNRDRLALVAETLMEKETLEGVLLESLLEGTRLQDDEVFSKEAERRKETEEKTRKRKEESDKAVLDKELPELLAPEGMLAKFHALLNGVFFRHYFQKIKEAKTYHEFEEFERRVKDKNFAAAAEQMDQIIRKLRRSDVLPGLRIRLGLMHFDSGNIDGVIEELTAALLSESRNIDKEVEKSLVSAISYFRIVSDELEKSKLPFQKFLKETSILQKVDSRYREWEEKSGTSITSLFSAN